MNFVSWDKLQVKHKVSLFGIGTVVITYLAYIFLLLPEWTRIDELTSQYNTELQQVKVIETFALAHPTPEQHLLELDGKIMKVDQMLPDSPEISSFLIQVEQLSQECGVRLSYLKPTKTVNKEGYREIEVEFLINGSFPQIMNFLSKTENGSRYISITNIAMQLGKNGLDSKLSAKIYSYGVSAALTPTNNKVSDTKK
ncbi:MAG: Pilus assembly protein PilO [Firmicutes bacterium]|nr:Pilus assembly protein PilO [Bacillota bacterium]